MTKTIDMQSLRYLKLFMKITHIQIKNCFYYNNMIIFAVPRKLLSKAIGKQAVNVKKISEILRKRIRIIALPKGEEDLRKFIESIVAPVTFNELEVKENEVIMNPGKQTKAALIGRNKRRLLEMKKIIQDYFEKDFRII